MSLDKKATGKHGKVSAAKISDKESPSKSQAKGSKIDNTKADQRNPSQGKGGKGHQR